MVMTRDSFHPDGKYDIAYHVFHLDKLVRSEGESRWKGKRRGCAQLFNHRNPEPSSFSEIG